MLEMSLSKGQHGKKAIKIKEEKTSQSFDKFSYVQFHNIILKHW